MRFLILLIFCTQIFAYEVKDTSDVPLRAVILVGSENEMNPPGLDDCSCIQVYGLDLPGSFAELERRVYSTFYGQKLTKDLILCIKRAVLEYYLHNNRPVVTVQVPKQDVSSGCLHLLVKEACVGEICVTGNCYFDSCIFQNAMCLEPCEVVNSRTLVRDLMWLNRNPFRNVEAVYTEGREIGTTNIELVVQDRWPYRIYAGTDNTGNNVTGNNRYFAGLTFGNLFWIDQILTYQFTSGNEYSRFSAHTLHYTAPLPWWKHSLVLFGGYSRVHSDFDVRNVVGTTFSNKGWSAQASLRYQIPLTPYPNILQEIFFGFDFKRTNNNLEFGGIPVIGKNVNLFQLMLAYQIGFKNQSVATSWEIEGFFSPGQWLGDQSNTDYQSLRAFANATYFYGRTSYSLIWNQPKPLELHIYLRGQAASKNLLPSEEYGIGGYDTVRGYQERLVNGDYAIIYNLELRTRKASLAQIWETCPWIDEFQLLGFFDYGVIWRHKTLPGEEKGADLLSVGPGIRYNIIPYVTLRADWGIQLKRNALNAPNQRIHFVAMLSY